MTAVSIDREENIIRQVMFDNSCIVLPGEFYRKDDRILVSRDGLRQSLHRRLFNHLRTPVEIGTYLLPTCTTGKRCLNPWHYEQSPSPYRDLGKCRNGHRYSSRDVNPDGSKTCHACRDARNARRRTGGDPMWVREKARQFCPQGHPYDEDNTYSYPTPAGGTRRKCKTCTLARRAASRS